MFDKDRFNKEQCQASNYEIYTSSGWSDINRVIDIKQKKIYRVLTNTGIVDVTEDHSLLNENGEIVKPDTLDIGDKLLHNYPTFDKTDLSLRTLLSNIDNVSSNH